jgi:hypothetical protein
MRRNKQFVKDLLWVLSGGDNTLFLGTSMGIGVIFVLFLLLVGNFVR